MNRGGRSGTGGGLGSSQVRLSYSAREHGLVGVETFRAWLRQSEVPPREESWLWIYFWTVGSLLTSVCLGPKSTSVPEYGSDGLSSSTEPELYTLSLPHGLTDDNTFDILQMFTEKWVIRTYFSFIGNLSQSRA
jgi:hypothetical protein